MDWVCLGHAMWLVDTGRQRILCDPLLGDSHHCGVFETVPRRRIDASALRPDLLVISHRHGDHFDIPSLRQLALLYPHVTVVTPDELVAWAARTLGFADVEVLGAGHQIELDAGKLVTMPSLAKLEWGVMIGTAEGVGWNQVDTVLPDPDKVRVMVDAMLQYFGAPHVALSLARWHPLLEIAAQLNRSTDFPHDDYARLLLQIEAVGARAVVPSAAGCAHTQSWRWIDHYEYPLHEARFLRDLAAISPDTDGFPARTGALYRVRGHEVEFVEHGAADIVEIEIGEDPRVYKPLCVPALHDPNPSGMDEGMMRGVVRDWIADTLAPAMAERWPRMRADGPLRFAIEAVFPTTTDAYTIVVGRDGARVTEAFDPDWDALNGVVGSLLWEVIDGRRHWGDMLLAGGLRTANRAYAIEHGRLRRAAVADTFLYYGLSYEASVERAVRWEVARVLDA
jgi:UDP-MurNAc hydroxylase